MNGYILNFLIALVLADVGLIICRKKVNPLCFKLGLLIVPAVAYNFFFNFNLELIQNAFVYVIGYVGCFWTLFCYLLVCSFKRVNPDGGAKVSVAKMVAFFALQLVLSAVFWAIPWAVDTFPLSNTDAVLFTLFAPMEGADNFILQSLITEVFIPASLTFGAMLVAQVVAGVALRRYGISGCFCRGPFKFCLESGCVWAIYHIEKFISFLFAGCVAVNLMVFPCIAGSASFEALFGEVVDSPLYRNYFVAPQESVAKKDSLKNLVVIFYESMSNNFERYTPELNEWKKRGVNFVPGGVSVSGTSWTIAGMVSSICGIPLNVPGSDGEYFGQIPTYLPYAVCLPDLLKAQNYKQLFVQGSSSEFTHKKRFWNYHGDVAVLDDSVFKARGRVPKEYNVFWGIEDKKIFSYAKEELDTLGKQGQPFAMYLLTVDTHQADGYLDPSCHYNEDSKYKNVLRCSSHMVDDFLGWMSQQPWFGNTVVMVVGDHTLQNLAAKAGLPKMEKLYTTAFILNADSAARTVEKPFTNLDYAPTIMEAMGWSLSNHAFGLGRSLLSKEPTMLEIYGLDSLNALLRQRSIQYDEFLLGK